MRRVRDVEAEELLGSRGRIRVLRVIAESGELNISEVARRAGMNYTTVDRHLAKLRDMGLLREKRYGKIRIFEAVFNTVTVSFERGGGVTVNLEVQKEH